MSRKKEVLRIVPNNELDAMEWPGMTKEILIDDQGKTRAEVEVPKPDNLPSVLTFAYHKSGSVMIDDILKTLAAQGGRSYLNLEKQLFEKGHRVDKFQKAVLPFLSKSGFVFGAFRECIDCLRLAAECHNTRIFLIRDPRDAVVSYYYSLRKSHWVPPDGDTREALLAGRERYSQLTLEEAVLGNEFEFLFKNMMRFGKMLRDYPGIIYRYEEIIFKKAEWIPSLACKLQVPLKPDVFDSLLQKHDMFPSQDNETAHVRHVSPGDYLNKLSPALIEHIERRYRDLFEILGYALTET